jgi:2'-5' RNA ligase
MTLDEIGAFRAAQVAWAGPSTPPSGLVSLRSSLDRELRRKGLAIEDRPFAAHATLVRRTAKPLARETIAPIQWRVHDFVLVRSEPGRGYSVMERWKLGD